MSGRAGKVVTIVQARMDSTRLPGKVMMDILGEPMLARVVSRSARAGKSDELAVATTTLPSDDVLAAWCSSHGVTCVRGHASDVLDRYHLAADQLGADIIVRITADCPLMDPGLLDRTVGAFLSARPEVDFAANRLPDQRTFPIGLDVEVCTRAALEKAWHEAKQAYQREHVMPYLYDEPGKFRVLTVENDTALGHLRWTVDTKEDLEFIRGVYRSFSGCDDFTWHEVLDLLEQRPDLARINQAVEQKGYRDHE